MTSTPVIIMAGFSLANRILLYASLATLPASFLAGVEGNLPISVGFLGFTIYQQYLFYIATKSKQLHALSLLLPALNTLYPFTYLPGITAGNYFVAGLMCVGTIGALVLNVVTVWIALKTTLPEGYGTYRFWLFGWRTLTPRWYKLFLGWGGLDVSLAFCFTGGSIFLAFIAPFRHNLPVTKRRWKVYIDTALIWGPLLVLATFWPFIVWMELVVHGNNLVSATDRISVYLFIAQTAPLAVSCVSNLIYKISLTKTREALLMEQATRPSIVVRMALAVTEHLDGN